MKKTKRRINVWFLGGLAIAVVVLGAGVHVLHGVQVRRNAAGLLEQAAEAEARGDGELAAETLKFYLSFEPDDGEAAIRYARLLVPEGSATDVTSRVLALRAFDRALVLLPDDYPDRAAIRRQAADLALELGDFVAARSHLERLRKDHPDDGELAYLLGTSEEALSQYEKAADLYAEAIEHAPELVEAYARRAALLRNRLKQPGEADRLMDAREVADGVIAATDGQSSRAYLERASYRQAAGLPGVEEDVARARELAPDEADVILAVAGLARKRAADLARDREEPEAIKKELDAAREELARGVALHPDDSRMYQALADLEMQAGRADEAVAALKEGISSRHGGPESAASGASSEPPPVDPVQSRLQLALADLLVRSNKADEARGVIQALRKVPRLRPEISDYLDFLDAQLLFNQGPGAEAAQALERVITKLVRQPDMEGQLKRAYLMLGECYRQTGDLDQRYNAYLQAVELNPPGDPLAISARVGLAAAQADRGQVDRAIDELRKATALPGAPASVRLDLVRALISRNQSLPPAQRQWGEIERALSKAAQALPDAPDVPLLRAQVALSRGQPDQAAGLLRQARDAHPEAVEPWLALALLATQQGTPDDGLATLDEARARLGDRVEVRLLRARLLINRGGETVADELAALGSGTEAFDADQRRQLLTGLAGAHTMIGDLEGSRRLWDQLIAEEPDNILYRLAEFDLAILTDDENALKTVVDTLHRIEGNDGLFWRYARARLLIRQASSLEAGARKAPLSEARTLLAAVTARQPRWPNAALSEAQIDDLLGNTDAARENYLRAIELGDRSPGAFRRAVELLTAAGEYEQADQLVRRFQDQIAQSSRLQRLAVGLAFEAEDDQRALGIARQAIATDSRDYEDHLWLGQVLWTAAQRLRAADQTEEADRLTDEADRAFQRAVTLGPTAPEARVARVQFLAATDRNDAARVAIQEAEKAIPKDEGPLALARCYTAVGDLAQAEAQYRKALAAAPENTEVIGAAASFYMLQNRTQDAEPLLRTLIGLQAKNPKMASLARQTLAQLLALQGGHAQSVEAMKLLGLAGGSAPATGPVEDQRARARVLAMQPDRAQRQQAIRLLENVLQQGAPRAEDQHLLAQLYEANDEWPKAHKQYQKLMVTAQKDALYPLYLAQYARALLSRGEAGEAQVWLNRLKQAQPEALVTMEIEARMLADRGEGKEAARRLSSYVEGKDNLVLPVAKLLEELGQVEAAEALYRKFVELPGAPEKALMLAQFLGRQGRLPEALDICEQAWRNCDPEAVSKTCVVLLYNRSQPDDEPYSRVARWLNEAIQDHPDIAQPLRFDLAVIHSCGGDYDQAEAIYRQILARDPTKAGPLNNLAWLLAASGGDARQALGYSNRAIELAGTLPDLRDTRAVVYMALGRHDEAVSELKEAIAIRPTAESYLHLAEAHLKQGNRGEAARALESAKARGLKVDALHPLERKAYDELVAKLKPR